MQTDPDPTIADVIAITRRKLHEGEARIADQPASFRWTWWPLQPGFLDEMASDYSTPSAEPQLEKEFYDEVLAITEALDEVGHVPDLAGWQKKGLARMPEAERRLHTGVWTGVNRRALALNLWDQIAMPLRRRAEVVFRILAPRDVAGSPIIAALPLNVYLVGVARKTAADAVEIERLRTRLGVWRTVATIAAGALGFLVLVGS